MSNENNTVHVMGISGGKDSSALAVYVRRNMPEVHAKMHYYFCDTGEGYWILVQR